MAGIISGNSLSELIQKAQSQYNASGSSSASSPAEVMTFNLEGGINQHILKIMTKDSQAPTEDQAKLRELVENAPQMARTIEAIEAEKAKQGYGVRYEFDTKTNHLKMYTYLKTNPKMETSPFVIEMMDEKTGKYGGAKTQSAQISLVDRTTEGKTFLGNKGTVALNRVLRSLQSGSSNMSKHLKAGSAIARIAPNDTQAQKQYLTAIQRSEAAIIRNANEAVRALEGDVYGVKQHYTSPNPKVGEVRTRTVNFGSFVDDLLDSPSVKKALKEAKMSILDLKDRIRTNVYSRTKIDRNIPSTIVKTPVFQEMMQTLAEISQISGDTININDDFFSKGTFEAVVEKSLRRWGGSRKPFQIENYGNLTPYAKQNRVKIPGGSKNPNRARYPVFHAKGGIMLPYFTDATPDNIYLDEQAARGQGRELYNVGGVSRDEAKKRQADIQTSLTKSRNKILTNLQNAKAEKNEKRIAKLRAELKELDRIGKWNENFDNVINEMIYSRATDNRFVVGRVHPRGDRDDGTSFTREYDGVRKLYRGLFSTLHEFESGDKIGGEGGTKGRASLVPENAKSFFEQLSKQHGGVNAIQLMEGGKISIRQMGDFAFGRLHDILTFFTDVGAQSDEVGQKIGALLKGTGLSSLYKFNTSTEEWEENREISAKILNSPDGLAKSTAALLHFLSDFGSWGDKLLTEYSDQIKKTGMDYGVSRTRLNALAGNLKEIEEDGKKRWEIQDGYLSFSHLNPLSMPEYGDPMNTTAHYDVAMARGAIGAMRAAGVNNGAIRRELSFTKEQEKAQKLAEERAKRAIRDIGESYTLFGGENPTKGRSDNILTSGYGSQFDIDTSKMSISDDAIFAQTEYEPGGTISQKTYEDSVMRYITEKALEIVRARPENKDKNITVDDLAKYRIYMDTNAADGEAFGVREYLTPKSASGSQAKLMARAIPVILSPEALRGDYEHLSEADRRFLVMANRSVAIGKSHAAGYDQDEAVKESNEVFQRSVDTMAADYIADIYNEANYRNSSTYKKNHTINLPNAAWGKAAPSAFTDNPNEAATIYYSPAFFHNMLKGRFGRDAKGLDKYAKAMGIDTTKSHNIEDKITEVMDAVVKDKKRILALSTRYPGSTGDDNYFTEIGIDDKLGKGEIRTNRGLAYLINMDWDGDYSNAVPLGFDKNATAEELQALYGEDREKLLLRTRQASMLGEQRLKKKANDDENAFISEEQVSQWANPIRETVDNLLRGALKEKTGALTNVSFAWRDYMAKNGLDEAALGDPTISNEKRAQIIQAIAGRYTTSEIAQGAISAKKISERAIADYGALNLQNMTPEDFQTAIANTIDKINEEVRNIMAVFKNSAFYGQDQTGQQMRAKFLEDLKGIGVIDDEGLFSARIHDKLMQTVNTATGGDKMAAAELYSKIFGTAVAPENLPTFNTDGTVILPDKDDFIPSASQMLEAFAGLSSTLGAPNMADVFINGRLLGAAATAETLPWKVWFEGGGRAKGGIGWSEKKGEGSEIFGPGGTINASGPVVVNGVTIIVNGQNIKGGGGPGSDGFVSQVTKAANLVVSDEYNPNKGVTSISNLIRSQIPKGAVSTTPDGLYEAAHNSKKYYNHLVEEFGEDAIKQNQDRLSASSVGEMAHAYQKFMSDLSAIIGDDIKTIEEARKIVDESGGFAPEIQNKITKASQDLWGDKKFYDANKLITRLYSSEDVAEKRADIDRRTNLLREEMLRRGYTGGAFEANVGLVNTSTGDVARGRMDYVGPGHGTNSMTGQKFTTIDVVDFKNLGKDYIDPQYLLQLIEYMVAVKQLMANFEQLGIGEGNMTAEKLNSILDSKGGGKEAAKVRGVLYNLGFGPTKYDEKGNVVKQGRYIDQKVIDTLLTVLGETGGNVDVAGSRIRGTIAATTKEGLITRDFTLNDLPKGLLDAVMSGSPISSLLVKYVTDSLNESIKKRGGGSSAKAQQTATETGETVHKYTSDIQGEKTSLSDINQLLSQRLAIEREIAKIVREREALTKRKESGDRDADIQIEAGKIQQAEYESLKQETEDAILSEFNSLTAWAQNTFNANVALRESINNRKIKLGDVSAAKAEQDQVAKDYERSLRERLAIESKIDQMTQRRNTTYSRLEQVALDKAIAAQNNKFRLVQEEGEQIKKNANLRDADRKRIEADYKTERTAQQAQNATNQHGSRNVWDMLGYDIKRSFAMIFDFGLAHRAINSIQMKFRELITTVQELDQAMTNIRIVTGQSADEAAKLMKSYNDLASQLGVTTKAVAEASNEWLKKTIVWVTLNLSNCWDFLRVA